MTALDEPRIAADIARLTGHEQGTWRHEKTLNRVLARLRDHRTAKITPTIRITTITLRRGDYVTGGAV